MAAPTPEVTDLTRRQRPLCLGLSVGHPEGTTGTIGPFVELRDGHTGFVSTSSVLAPEGARTGDYIHQPGRSDTDLLTGATRAGTLGLFVRPHPGGANEVDAAVVVVAKDEIRGNVAPAFVPDAGRTIAGVADTWAPGDVVAFVGRTSGYSEGQITAFDLNNLTIQFGKDALTFEHCIEVESMGSEFCKPGDSGALVWRRSDMKAIGLVFAAAEQKDGRQLAYLLPVNKALAALDVHLL